MTVVCLPDSNAVELLGPVPGGVEVITWDGKGEKPERLGDTTFWIPQVEDSDDLNAKLEALPKLKVIQLTSAGVEDIVDHIPDGVTLCNAKGVHGPAVAELVLALILASQRRLPHFLAAQQQGSWDPLQADDLVGKRVLIIGAGDLAEQTAKRLTGFDAIPVLVGHTARGDIHATEELPQLLPGADIVVLTVPLTKETEGMVDARFLSAMPDDALLVNVARGKVVGTDALVEELYSGRLRAALDVTEPEPLPTDHPLWNAPGVIITPHAAGHIKESGRRAFAMVSEQIRRFVADEELINVVKGAY